MTGLAGALGAIPRPNGDNSLTFRATVRAVDFDARRLEVEVGGDTLIAPHLGFIDYYNPGDTVLLIKDDTGPIVLGALGQSLDISADAAPGSDPAPTGLALSLERSTVTAAWDAYAGASQYRLRSSINGGTTWAPTVTTTDTSEAFGIGQGQTLTVQVAAYVSGAWTLWSSSVAIEYALPAGQIVTVQAGVIPSDSGTYRVSRAAWDRWNTDRFGGATDVYQGDAFGSGTLIGWVGYGDRIANLGALEIVSATLKVKRNGWTNLNTPVALTVQGSPSGTQPAGSPSSSGDTATTNAVGLEQWASVALTASMREGLRTGSIKGLVAVGSGDSGWYGTGGSMVLDLTYIKAA